MKLTYDRVREMNNVQFDIFKTFIEICEKLNLRYFLVHGSLLGAVTRNAFYPFDDDIDVAMLREDYNKLIEQGPSCIPEGFFIQSYITEQDFPLTFGKIRNSETAFIQPQLKKLNINMGMFIDVFPIDYYPDSKLKIVYLKILESIYSARISTRYFYDTKQPLWRILSRAISVVLCPSWNKAVQKKAELYTKIKKKDRIILIGGKLKERGIPTEWFSEGIEVVFEDMPVVCPKAYDSYLKHIYGDYANYNPVHEYMNKDGTLTVAADIVDPKKTYRFYRHSEGFGN